ncbi:hypothetical protein Cob_v004926 [Colletotrichum orbiculare MAFF 240422]|uniref:Uncharacterized protein n=1 Tax=Colletotrichum orbiculare (strain 104-T / ATCC 96160 / CBS 514.97 / LARS 414 / MAFF 240422) TaxID=1213857 RepID=A0A484FVX7_COLOR|nr:hypothetical protein Cob_v004926 [Colletotrichum orbiculare MAFF 240422]
MFSKNILVIATTLLLAISVYQWQDRVRPRLYQRSQHQVLRRGYSWLPRWLSTDIMGLSGTSTRSLGGFEQSG